MPLFAPAFISYSRKDYYFAESLAGHLSSRSIPVWLDSINLSGGVSWNDQIDAAIDGASCIIVIASRNSIKSKGVQDEWRRALNTDKRIIVVSFGHATIKELAGCQHIDFRGAFGPAVKALGAALHSTGDTAHTQGRSLSPFKLPPGIVLLALTLAVPSIGYFLVATYRPEPTAAPLLKLLLPVLTPIFVSLMMWGFCLSFLRRRMGMTRLVSCLCLLSGFYLQPLLLMLMHGDLRAYPTTLLHQLSYNWTLFIVLAAIPLYGVFGILISAPEDLLRWTPTGRAWEWYRSRWADKRGGFATDSTQLLFGNVEIVCDPDDEPAGSWLRGQLKGSVHEPAGNGRDENTTILLLTNRTRLTWIGDQTRRGDTKVVLVAASTIRIPPELEPLRHRQWLDLRDWNVDHLLVSKLPSVPEAMTSVKLPLAVRFVYHLLCALTGLLFVIFRVASGENSSNVQDATLLCTWFFLWLLARGLLRRAMVESIFWKSCLLTLSVTICSIGWQMWEATKAGFNIFLAAVVFIFLGVFIILMVHLRPRIASWFPNRMQFLDRRKRIGAPRNWQTLLWTLVYFYGWGLLLAGE